MHSFKEYLAEDAGNVDNATKIRNHLIKKHGAEPKRATGTSNPYNKYQSLRAHHNGPKKLLAALKAEGWEHDSHHHDGSGEIVKRGDAQISIWHTGPYKGSVRITGPKKGKPLDNPHYD